MGDHPSTLLRPSALRLRLEEMILNDSAEGLIVEALPKYQNHLRELQIRVSGVYILFGFDFCNKLW